MPGTGLRHATVSATVPLTCDSGKAGTLRYNSTNTALELCTGTGRQVMGVGIPAGTISAFASTTCSTGWSEYTPARGRFLRRIDNGAGNDPDATRVAGSVQGDALSNHSHKGVVDYSQYNSSASNSPLVASSDSNPHPYYDATLNQNSQTEAVAFGSTSIANETRPKNVAVTFCQFNGTSNGWNNPLSGGSTVPGGSTGQIQYNTSGSFDASTGLTWDNANSRLTTVNISATALTVNGVPITGEASGDRIVSGSTSVVAKGSGTVEVSGTLTLKDNPDAGCVSSTLGAFTQINHRLYFCRP